MAKIIKVGTSQNPTSGTNTIATVLAKYWDGLALFLVKRCRGVFINTPDIVIELCEWKAEAAPHYQVVYTAEFTLPSCLHG